MPQLEIQRLDKASSPEQIKAAISACIANEVNAGKDQAQASAMCYSMARAKTEGNPASPPETPSALPSGGVA